MFDDSSSPDRCSKSMNCAACFGIDHTAGGRDLVACDGITAFGLIRLLIAKVASSDPFMALPLMTVRLAR
jgi:hypothetical protein